MLAPSRPSPTYTVYRTERRRFDGPAPGPWRRARRIALAASLVVLVPTLVSFASTLTQPSNSSVFINAVEWLRSNGARGLVNQVENAYYSLTAPAKGGPALHRLPGQKGALTAAAAHHIAVHYYVPAAIKPLTAGLPGEGTWHATWAAGGSRPPVLITSFRPEPIEYPRVVVGVAWIDHTRTSVQLYPGRQGAGRSPAEPRARGGSPVAALRSRGDVQQRLQAV